MGLNTNSFESMKRYAKNHDFAPIGLVVKDNNYGDWDCILEAHFADGTIFTINWASKVALRSALNTIRVNSPFYNENIEWFGRWHLLDGDHNLE